MCVTSTWPRTKETACLVFLSFLTRESACTPTSRCRGEYHLRCCGPGPGRSVFCHEVPVGHGHSRSLLPRLWCFCTTATLNGRDKDAQAHDTYA